MASPQDSIRVLHVDDEPDFVDLAAQFLERVDDRFEVIPETSADRATEHVHDNHLDCIVSDYDMPERNGLEFLKAVREVDQDFPFILFTGKGSEEIAAEAITAGVTDYIQKEVGTDQYTVLANQIANSVERYQAIRQTELSQRAMDTAQEGLSLVEPDGTFSYVNPAFAELFGYSPEEMSGAHWTILYDNEQAQRLEHDILPAVRETGYWVGETVRLTKHGDRLITDHRLARTSTGAIVCTAQDVTQERSAPDSQSDEYDLLFDAIEDYAFYTLDHEGYVTRWNDGAKRLTGFEPTEILGNHLSEFFTDEDQASGKPERLIETAKVEGKISHQGWRVRKDGSRFWADSRLSASYDEHGTIRGFGKMIREAEKKPATP